MNVASLGDSDGVQTGTGRYQTESEGNAADIGNQLLICDYMLWTLFVNIKRAKIQTSEKAACGCNRMFDIIILLF